MLEENREVIDFTVAAWVFLEKKILATIEVDRDKLEALPENEPEQRNLVRGRIRAYRDILRWRQQVEEAQSRRV